MAVAGPIGPAIVVSASAEPVALSLRDRFRLALSVTSAVAQPFHFRGDAAETGHSADTHCLAQAVYYEARGESTPGQAAVAQVVLNRVRHPAFPKTVCGVVFQRSAQGCQFSFACNGAMHGGMEQGAWRRAEQVAERALGGSVMADVGEATQFQAARAGWASGLMKVAQIGEHVFYRFGGHQGSPGMFHDRAEPSVAPRAPQPSEVRVAALTPNAAPKLTEASMAPVQATSPAPAAAVSPSSAPAIKGGSESVAKPKVQAPVVSTVKTEDTASKSITVAAAD